MRGVALFCWMMLVTPAYSAKAAEITLNSSLSDELLALAPIGTQRVTEHLDGHVVVVVSFFASWCPPCRTEFQHLNTLKTEFGDTLEVIAINVFEQWDDNDEARLQAFLEDTRPLFAVVAATEHIRSAFGDVQRIPSVFVFSVTGVPVLRFVHERGAEKRTAGIDELRAAILEGLSSQASLESRNEPNVNAWLTR